jgi:beta-glucosidase
MKNLILASALTAIFSGTAISQNNQPTPAESGGIPLYKNPHAEVEARVDDLFGRMSIDDKVLLLNPNFMSTKPNTRLGIPQLKFENGSYGNRSGRSTSFCTAVNFAATWDPELINSVGIALAEEIKTKGTNMLLGPVIEIHRIPQAGRNAESYSEDPFLTGSIVSSYIKGIQSGKVPATACFLGAKTQEYHTHFYNARVDERTLNEIYFPAFRKAVEESHVWGLMTPYNRVNGVHVSNNQYLLWDMLKDKWKFQGLVMTDWAGVQNFEESIYSGLDLDMPNGQQYTIEKLTNVYKRVTDITERPDFTGKFDRPDFKILADRLDESVRRILRVMIANGFFEPEQTKTSFDTIAHRKLSLQVARESITLLKNENKILPLERKKIKSIAVIGPNADVSRNHILWASKVLPYIEITPLEGISNKVKTDIKILYSQGCDINEFGRFVTDEYVKTDNRTKGFLVEFFDNGEFNGKPAFSTLEHSIGYSWMANPVHPETEEGNYSVRASGLWSPPRSGYYRLFNPGGKVSVSNQYTGKTKNDPEEIKTKLFKGVKYQYFEKGKNYTVVGESIKQTFSLLELRYIYHEEDGLRNAVEVARKSDVAVLFLGFSEMIEREGQDRAPDLPENQLELISSVSAVNPNLIVVLNTGSGVSIEPWADKVPAIIEAYYPGQEGGTAIADILFGDVNPSGKLPFTCMKQWKDSPVYGYYPQGTDEMVHFVEGIYVGYRWFDRQDTPDAAFPFGHGLSYTTFSYSDLVISPGITSTGEVTAIVKICNTGNLSGTEVAQLYIGDDHASVDRPVKELKGYKRVFLKPGETTFVQFTIHLDDLKFYDVNEHDWKAEPGAFTVFIGSSSQDIRQKGKFNLTFF